MDLLTLAFLQNIAGGSGGGGGGADLSTAEVFIANFWSDPLQIDKGTVDPLAQFIHTV